jgi:prevent-host-death family protein
MVSNLDPRQERIALKTDIRPISNLKNKTADIVREVAESRKAVIITQHGKAKVVMLDFEEYERWKETMAILKLIAQGEADVAAGRTVSQRQAFSSARAAIARARKGR